MLQGVGQQVGENANPIAGVTLYLQ
jgi:hypothetical protein